MKGGWGEGKWEIQGGVWRPRGVGRGQPIFLYHRSLGIGAYNYIFIILYTLKSDIGKSGLQPSHVTVS